MIISVPLFILVLLASSFGLANEVDANANTKLQPENKIVIYSSLPASISHRQLAPVIDHMRQEMGIEAAIPRGDCEAYRFFQLSKEALVSSIFRLWKPLVEKGYVPLVESVSRFEMIIISRQNVASLQDLAGKKVAVATSYIDLYKDVINNNAADVLSEITFVNNNRPDDTVLQVLNGEVEYGLIGRVVWEVTVPNIKNKLHALHIATELPLTLIFAHPDLTEERKQQYSDLLMSIHRQPPVKEVLDDTYVKRFVASQPETYNNIKRISMNELVDPCQEDNDFLSTVNQ